MEAKSFEKGLTEVTEMLKRLQSTLLLHQSKMEESFRQARQDFTLASEKFHRSIKAAIKEEINQEGQVDFLGVQLNQRSPNRKVFKSVEAAEKEKKSKLIQAAVKEKKNRERQAHSYGLQQNRCYKRMDAKLFWKKFVVASQPTKKLRISLGKRFERLSFQEQPYSKRVPRGPCKTAYLHEEIKDSSKTEGNPTISEEDGTDSLREKGENEWQPASENDLQNIQDTLDCCNLKPRMVVTRDDRARSKPSRCSYGPDLRCDHVLHLVVVQGLGSNYKSSGLEFHSTMILVLHLESNGLYGLLFGQRMTWDPGIRVIKILKQHLEDKLKRLQQSEKNEVPSPGHQ
ncbi:hypothetical protein Tco_1015466 [Tanacetum coccineum]|uniref:Uncharacterized protein n=1 Tax=Tanacetum coccineum TaxID=301880 RepID=A0ABQ5FKY8_9ASTR